MFSVPTETLLSPCSGHEGHCSDTLSRVQAQGTSLLGSLQLLHPQTCHKHSCLDSATPAPQLLSGRAVAGRVTSCRPSCPMRNSCNVQPLLRDFQLARKLFRTALQSETLPIQAFCFSQVSDQVPGWEGHLPAPVPSSFIPCWHFLPVNLLHI